MEGKVCLLLAPVSASGTEIRKRLDTLLTYVINPAVQRAGYTLLRMDQINTLGPISSQMISHIFKASIIIADLSGSNPNVMYELGVAHSVRKPVIQITTDVRGLPFDNADMHTIVVDMDSRTSLGEAEQQILQAISEMEQKPQGSKSPVSAATHVLFFQEQSYRFGTLDENNEKEFNMLLNVLQDIESRLKSLENNVAQIVQGPEKVKDYSRRIFIVHGHDGELKFELARLLERLDFIPVILHEQPDKGRTIFDKLNGEMSDIGFAFVILTPDDKGGPRGIEQDQSKPRARQNVVFEHGLFVGYLKPDRVCAIRKGDVEIPSDLQGVVYKSISAGNSIASIMFEIANELRAAGYVVDFNKLSTI